MQQAYFFAIIGKSFPFDLVSSLSVLSRAFEAIETFETNFPMENGKTFRMPLWTTRPLLRVTKSKEEVA